MAAAGELSAAGSDVKAKAGLGCYRMLEAVVLTAVIVAVCGVFTVPTIFFALRPSVVGHCRLASDPRLKIFLGVGPRLTAG